MPDYMNILSKMDWDLIEYKERQARYNREHGIVATRAVDNQDPPSVSLASLRRPVDIMTEGNVTEIRAGKYVERRVKRYQQKGGFIRRLPHEVLFDGTKVKPYVRLRDICVDEETGEEIIYVEDIKLCKDKQGRMADPKQVKKTCDNFKWLVRANERKIRLFVTLTYAENMTDTKRLYDDYRKFVQKLRRAVPDVTGYLVAFEPQKRGAWHAHVLLLSDNAFLRIANKRMRMLWGHGFTKTQRVNKINDIGTYLTSYLTNLKEGEKTKKGARLYMYPSGFHFLRASTKGVERTKIEKWYGKFDEISYDGEIELIYEYDNIRPLDKARDIWQHTKIFCFREKPPLGGCGIGEE